ncbi:hypothetical protein BDV59DRAFT_36903 [Aspergillus ambiguus]|uniref:uncharacterized protein n=1 Tax=Aspergillus ambiguus TaxID=176160 RepID=UPI003CCD6756
MLYSQARAISQISMSNVWLLPLLSICSTVYSRVTCYSLARRPLLTLNGEYDSGRRLPTHLHSTLLATYLHRELNAEPGGHDSPRPQASRQTVPRPDDHQTLLTGE